MISINNISKSYDGHLVLNNLSYKFEDYNTYYIKGLSGVGKTTLMNIIYGYEKQDNGSIDNNNNNIEYMLQEPMVFSNLSVRDNFIIKLSGKSGKLNFDDNFYKSALTKVDLHISLDKKVGTLSGGELQRFQLAEYMLIHPDVIILDEPACKLDRAHRLKIYDLIDVIFKDSIKIIITHDEEVMELEGIILEMREENLCEIH